MNAQEAAQKTQETKVAQEQHRLLKEVPKQIADAEKAIQWAVERGYTKAVGLGYLSREAQRHFEDKGYVVTLTAIYWDHVNKTTGRSSFFDLLFRRSI
jgi:hypothetical protein